MKLTPANASRRGYVLIAVLIVIAVLSLAAYRYSAMMLSEYRATNRISKNSEVKAIAESGIHYTAAILSDPNAMSSIGSNPYNNTSYFQGIQVGKGKFSIITPAYALDTGSGTIPYYYGVVDEGSKLNPNALVAIDPSAGGIAYKALSQLPNMTDQIAYSIIDWIDADSNVSPDGAEDETYMALPNPYHCKNSNLDSIEELLLVQGVTPQLLFGDDTNRNGIQDGNETASSGTFSFGWAPYLTVYSHESNVDPTNSYAARTNVNSQSMQTLLSTLSSSVGNDLAGFIVAYRVYGASNATAGGKTTTGTTSQLYSTMSTAVSNGTVNAKQTISSIWELVGAKVAITGQRGDMTIYTSPLIDTTTLTQALNSLTTKSTTSIVGRINVNTASQTVLNALQGMGLTSSDITAIVSNQPDPTSADQSAYQTTAWLYSTAGLTTAKLKTLDPYITTTSQVYRIQSIGYYDKDGPMARIEAVVDTNLGYPRFLYYRDLTELGRGIDPRSN
jgi:type II secretory pathway component PulK